MTTLRFKKINIEPYLPGKSSARKIQKVIKLSANESALGVSPRAKKLYQIKTLNFLFTLMENQKN